MRELYHSQLLQSDEKTIKALLLDALGDPVLGLLDPDVSISYYRSEDISPQSLLLSNSNFVEESNGFYDITFPSSMTTYTGSLLVVISGASIDNVSYRFDVVSKNPGNVVTSFLIETVGNEALPDVQVDIWNSLQTAILWSGVSDENGQLLTALHPGDYKILPRGIQIDFGLIPLDITVIGPLPQSFTINGSKIVTPTASSPDVCKIYGYIYDICGIPDNQVSPDYIAISVQRDAKMTKVGNKLYTMDGVRISSDENGYFELELVRNMRVHLKIPRVNLEKFFVVPDQATEDITNLI